MEVMRPDEIPRIPTCLETLDTTIALYWRVPVSRSWRSCSNDLVNSSILALGSFQSCSNARSDSLAVNEETVRSSSVLTGEAARNIFTYEERTFACLL